MKGFQHLCLLQQYTHLAGDQLPVLSRHISAFNCDDFCNVNAWWPCGSGGLAQPGPGVVPVAGRASWRSAMPQPQTRRFLCRAARRHSQNSTSDNTCSCSGSDLYFFRARQKKASTKACRHIPARKRCSQEIGSTAFLAACIP